MALLGDVERIAVVGAEREERRGRDREERGQRVQVLRDGAFADQDRHALADLLQRLLGAGRLVVGADSGREIAVEVEAAHERRVAVDVAVREGLDLRKAGRDRPASTPGKFMNSASPMTLRMAAIAREVGRIDARAGRLEMRRRHAARQL